MSAPLKSAGIDHGAFLFPGGDNAKSGLHDRWVVHAQADLQLKALLNKTISVDDLTENDVRPLIKQKSVDMKMGIDLALIATKRLADLLIVIAGDSDIVPALKLARREGMQVGLDPLRNHIRPELSEHVDFISTKIPAPQGPA